MTDWLPIKDFSRNEYPRFVLIWTGEFSIAERKANRRGEYWWETSAGETDDCFQNPTHFAVVTPPR